MNKPILQVENLYVGYGKEMVLTDVSLSVSAGECLAVVGPNGCGKSTLLRAVSGHVNARRGLIRFLGKDVTCMPVWRRSRAGLVHILEGARVFPSMTVEDNILTAIRAGGPESKTSLENAYEIIPQLETTTMRRRMAGALSGGERQLVVLARAIVMRPIVVLLDSPFLGVASNMRATVQQCIKKWIDEAGVGVVLVEHDQRVVQQIACGTLAMV
jgi:branched-chain amino acid transport system ATP-binding protein